MSRNRCMKVNVFHYAHTTEYFVTVARVSSSFYCTRENFCAALSSITIFSNLRMLREYTLLLIFFVFAGRGFKNFQTSVIFISLCFR